MHIQKASKQLWVRKCEDAPSLKELAGLLDCILLNARNAGHEDISLSGQHVLKPVAKFMEERQRIAVKATQCHCNAQEKFTWQLSRASANDIGEC